MSPARPLLFIPFFKKLFLVLATFLILFGAVGVLADQDKSDIARQLKRIRSKIVQTERDLVPLKEEEEATKREIKSLEAEVKKLLEDQQNVKARLEAINKSQESLSAQMVAIREEISKKKSVFEKRVVHMYKTRRRLMPLSFLLSSQGGADDFYKRSAYLKYLVKSDSNRLKEFTSLLENLKYSKEEFANLGREFDEQIKKDEETKHQFNLKQFELAKSVKSLESKISKLARELVRYNAQEDEYEQLLKDLTRNRSANVDGLPRIGVKPRSLTFPVKGKVIQHFGRQKHGEFKDIIFVKGVEVTSEEGEAVKVVLPGEVVFSSELPGFGSVLIVDHGSGYVSLYGRILPNKKVGDKVAAEEVIAVTGSKDSFGKNFYFELRQDGKALNPERFFTKL